jgi:hypothetical protein
MIPSQVMRAARRKEGGVTREFEELRRNAVHEVDVLLPPSASAELKLLDDVR